MSRMEQEKDEVDDAEHEADLQEALANQTRVVRLVVDKWFVDKGFCFGKTTTGEIVFIHASVVQGAEVLMVGTVAWAQVVSDPARAEGRYRARRAWGRDAWRQERDKEKANRVAQQVRRPAALTAELAAQSEKKTAAVCDQPPGLGSSPGTLRRLTWGRWLTLCCHQRIPRCSTSISHTSSVDASARSELGGRRSAAKKTHRAGTASSLQEGRSVGTVPKATDTHAENERAVREEVHGKILGRHLQQQQG